jgi:hypothetical protein
MTERLDKYDIKVRVQKNVVTTLVIPVLVKSPVGKGLPQYSLDSDNKTQKESSDFEETSSRSGLFDESRSAAVADAGSLSDKASTNETTKGTDAFFSDDNLFDQLTASVDGGKSAVRSSDISEGLKEKDDLLSVGFKVLSGRLW